MRNKIFYGLSILIVVLMVLSSFGGLNQPSKSTSSTTTRIELQPQSSNYLPYQIEAGADYLLTLRQTYYNESAEVIDDAETAYILVNVANWTAIFINITFIDILDDATPALPTAVNLEVNGSAVSDGDTDTGEWICPDVPINCSESEGVLRFDITADADTSCVIDIITVILELNDTATSLLAISDGSNCWAVGGDYSEFNDTAYYVNATINATLPYNWFDYETWRDGSENMTGNLTVVRIGNVDLVQITNATNGLWIIMGYSVDFMDSIEALDSNGDIIYSSELSEDIDFEVGFTESVSGYIELDVFEPVVIGDALNYYFTDTIVSDTSIVLGTWYVSTSVDEDTVGYYRITSYWYNDTDAGFEETTVRIYEDVPDADSEGWDFDDNETPDATAEAETTLIWVRIIALTSCGIAVVGIVLVYFKYISTKPKTRAKLKK